MSVHTNCTQSYRVWLTEVSASLIIVRLARAHSVVASKHLVETRAAQPVPADRLTHRRTQHTQALAAFVLFDVDAGRELGDDIRGEERH